MKNTEITEANFNYGLLYFNFRNYSWVSLSKKRRKQICRRAIKSMGLGK